MTDASRTATLSRSTAGKVYDLGVEYFGGMPGWYLLDDPHYQYWLTHTPQGTTVNDPVGVGVSQHKKVAYIGDAISMYTHTSSHIDVLNHFGLNGEVGTLCLTTCCRGAASRLWSWIFLVVERASTERLSSDSRGAAQ
jgi:hypothetical protein